MPFIKIGQSTYNNVTVPVMLLQGGATRDAESRPVNGKDHAQVSIAAGEDKEGNPMYITLNGWGSMAQTILRIKKADNILAVGRLKTREYNGNIYNDIDADFVVKHGAGFEWSVDDLPDPETLETRTEANVRVAETFAKHVNPGPKPEDFELVDDEEGLPF